MYSLVIKKIKIVLTFDVLNLLATYHDNFHFIKVKNYIPVKSAY